MRCPAGCVVALLVLAACKPAPEKVCDHMVELDEATPPAVDNGLGRMTKRVGRRPDERASCVRQLRELDAADPPAYRACAKCVLATKAWTDAWDCWVLDHLSATKQPARVQALSKCNGACNTAEKSCVDACRGDEGCFDRCQETLHACATGCQFD